MKLTGSHIIIGMMAIVIAVLSWTLIYIARDDLRFYDEEIEEEIEIESRALLKSGRAVVRVDSQSQAASGILTEALRPAQYETSLYVYGRVVDVASLLELRGRYLAAKSEERALRAAVSTARIEYQRAQALYEDDRNISERALRDAESRFHVAQARFAAAQSTESVLRDSLATEWGPVVGEWAMTPDSRSLAPLLTRRSVLVQLVFPYQFSRSLVRPQLLLTPVAALIDAVEARLVSDAPRGSSALPGNTYFYIVDGADLRVGTRVVARVATDEATFDGVIVPNVAVVWHAGKSWVYKKHDSESFGRYEISTASQLDGGWFQQDGMRVGDEVVVSGAQLLLSEELKFQIRNENED
ncbi:MAG: hypothetical protein GTO41_00570 [Burkholderiales bacterium]|nr:hypothetical protein [Burkholderiales bacterium]